MKAFLAIGFGGVLRQGLTFLAQLVVAKSLGSGSFGEIAYAYSLYLVLAGVGDLGTRLYCWRTTATSNGIERERLAIELFRQRLILSGFVAVALFFVAPLPYHGSLAKLVAAYMVPVACNQASFDWIFLSLERYRNLLVFQAATGVLYFASICVLVRTPSQAVLVPLLFAVSYGIPGFFLVAPQLGRLADGSRRMGQRVRAALSLPLRSWRFVPYDMLQRIYTAFTLLVMQPFYPNAVLGEFRVAFLVYAFVASVAVYFASSHFNRVSRAAAAGNGIVDVSSGVWTIVAVLVPVALVGQPLIAAPLQWVLAGRYALFLRALVVLMPSIALVAVVNFLREILVSAGEVWVSVASYAVTIVLTCALVAWLHPQDLSVLTGLVVAGEVAGLAVILAFSRARIFGKGFTYTLVGAVAFAVAMRIAYDQMPDLRLRSMSLALHAAAVMCVYGAYLFLMRDRILTGLKAPES